jgi:C4-dicarboxylate transporter DctM subunit
MLWVAIILFIAALVAGMPVVFALGLSGVVALFVASDLPLMLVPQRIVGTIDSFTLLAVPFFIFAGEVMERGGVSRRLIHLASCFVGHVRGGLAMVCVLSSMIFAGISGSTAADASAIGSIQIPAMIKRGYKPGFVAAIQSAAATMGPIVPPSSLAIIYGSIANVSIGKLFLAGFIPGIMICIALMFVGYVYSIRLGYPVERRGTLRETLKALLDSIWALFVPVIILGGIVSGMFTATESGAIAAVYALFVAMVIYRELSFKDLPQLILKAAMTTSLVMIVIGTAGVFSWIMASENLPFYLTDGLLRVSKNPTVVLLLILAFMLAIGCVMEIVAASIIMIPVLYPIANQLGFNDVHFAMLIMMTMAIGAITPPIGVTLYITLGIAKTPISEVNRYIWVFMVPLLFVLLVAALVPRLVTILPALIMK